MVHVTKLEFFAKGMRALGVKYGLDFIVEEMFGMDGYDLMSYHSHTTSCMVDAVKELCSSVGLSEDSVSSEFFGIEVIVKHEWMAHEGNELYNGDYIIG